MSTKRPLSPSPTPTPTPNPQISLSPPLTDRASTFIAAFSPTASAQTLQSLPDFRTASHRIAAWRRRSSQTQLGPGPGPGGGRGRGLFETGHDDDGEAHGGKAVEGVLREMGVEGCAVVARWFGGVMLGPVRFDHIRGCAREAVVGWKKGEEEGEGRGEKRVKREDGGEGERERLVGVLEERDRSVGVLRGLLAEKKRELEGGEGGGAVGGSPVKGTNYGIMEVGVLRRLEQVRDKTIGWILGQIEEVEKALVEKSEGLLPDGKVEGADGLPGESRREDSDKLPSERRGDEPGEKPTVRNQEILNRETSDHASKGDSGIIGVAEESLKATEKPELDET